MPGCFEGSVSRGLVGHFKVALQPCCLRGPASTNSAKMGEQASVMATPPAPMFSNGLAPATFMLEHCHSAWSNGLSHRLALECTSSALSALRNKSKTIVSRQGEIHRHGAAAAIWVTCRFTSVYQSSA